MTGEPISARLITAARDGDPAALERLYVRFSGSLYAVAYHLLRDRDDAQDVLHDVFLGLPEALIEYDERGQLEAWLKTLTVRASLMALRATRRRHELPFDDLPGHAVETAPPSTIDLVALDRALGRLPETLREVFVLKVVEGYSHEEIATLLGISIGASRVNLHRARQELERRLRS